MAEYESSTPPSLQDKSTDSTRRPRGRPPGAKNKPKAPIIVTQDAPNTLKSHLLEIRAGEDIASALSAHARRRERGICVLSATGTVANVTIRQPAGHNAVTLQGRFEILSLSGTVLPPPVSSSASGLSIFLAGGNGQVVGGLVVGRLMALSPVVLTAGLFSNAIFERLPLVEEQEEEVGRDGDDDNNNNIIAKWKDDVSQSSDVTGGGGGGSGSGGGGGGGGNNGLFPFINVGGNNNLANSNYPILAADMFGWGGNPTVARPLF